MFYVLELQQSNNYNPYLMWHDVQLSKGKLNMDRLIESSVRLCKEKVYHHSAPCAVIKRRSEPSCDYVVAVRERGNSITPISLLQHFNDCLWKLHVCIHKTSMIIVAG